MAGHDVRTNNHSGLWENWVIDVTKWPEFCFYPREEDGSIVTGVIYVGDKCPGKLVEIIHDRGPKEVDKWRRQNPSWHEQYRATPPTKSDRDDWRNDPRIKFTASNPEFSHSRNCGGEELSIPGYILEEMRSEEDCDDQ